MRSFGKFLFVLALLVALPLTLAQKPSANVPVYNAAQEQTFSGIVKETRDYQCPISGTIGSHISVTAGFDTIEVHLAPATFLKQYDIVVKAGEKVTVTGVKFEFDGKPAMLARTVTVGQSTFTFRDKKGRPEW